MGNVVAIEQDKPSKKAWNRKFSLYLENAESDYLLTGTDQRGKTGYFFKMNITGLQERIFGPYDSRSMAVECFDRVLEAALEAFCVVQGEGRMATSGMEHIALPTNLTPVSTR
ncbi:MAG: hypothetical protein ABI684_15375 [Nitrospirota bacterium]